MLLSLVVIIGGVTVLICLGMAIGQENESDSQLRRRQDSAREVQRLREERALLEEACDRLRIERQKLQRASTLHETRCPNCPYRDQLG
jgi:hypothetical protein